jgi:hypothetical protein
LDTLPIPAQTLETYYHINGAQLERHYKEHLSGYYDWEQLSPAGEWLLFPQNMGSRLSIDETSLSDGELYTIVTNKAAKGRKTVGYLETRQLYKKSDSLDWYLTQNSVAYRNAEETKTPKWTEVQSKLKNGELAKPLFISLAMSMFVSCSNKKTMTYELDGLSNPLLKEWFDCFKAADNSFAAEKFTAVYLSEKPEKLKEFSKDWYDWGPGFADWFIFSPDSSYYLDLDFYTCLDCISKDGIWVGGDPDKKVILVDVRNKKAIDIIPTNSNNGADDAFWVNFFCSP